MKDRFRTCEACGAESAGQGRYCSQCGKALYIACSSCGQRNFSSSGRCSGCRQRIRPEEAIGEASAELRDGRPLERRQLTIMFTDLVNSTGLADSMDPEDFRALIEAHRTIAVAPIARFGGVVARYMGDGMLVLFGYPEAHEDDPERAVRAGLEVASATVRMNERWVGEGKGRIAVRIGVHTGIVVVGDVLKADVRESMAIFGDAPSIASRLQALARPNSVMLSGATKALLPPAILCETRGKTVLKGLNRPVEVFSALKVREGLGDRRAGGRVLPFVNREKELAVIRRRWAAARRGEGQWLVIEGEPGIGKSRLIRAVEERIVTQPSRWLITRTSPYAANTDFFAFSELFRHVLALEASSGNAFTRLKRTLKGQGIIDPEIAIGLASLLDIEILENATTTSLQPERARELTLKAITAWLQHESNRQPLVLVIEDLHWADASTLEAIERLKDTLSSHPVLLIGTTRSATRTSLTGGGVDTAAAQDGSPAQPGDAGTPLTARAGARAIDVEARSAKQAQASPAGAASTASTLRLERLGAGYAEDLLGHVLRGAELPKSSVTTLLERANGVPLYLEELPKPVLEAGGAGGVSVALPATLRDSLMARLDGMGEAKAVAQTAAVLGHSFERSLLERVWEGDGNSLNAGLVALADAALIRPEEEGEKTSSYGFRHALFAEIAYDSMLRDERRRIHRHTVDILSENFKQLADMRPELLARHHDAAENHKEAFNCWLRAGKLASRRSANVEALGYFQSAEAALDRLENEEIDKSNERRLSLLLARGPAQIALLGWSAPEVEETYQSALPLTDSRNIEYGDCLAAWLGLYNVYLLRGDLAKAHAAADKLQQIGSDVDHEDALPNWYRLTAYCDFLAADFRATVEKMSKSIDLYRPDQQERHTARHGTNPTVIACSIMAWASWFLGRTDLAEAASQKAMDAACQAEHPFSLGYALCLAASLAQCMNRPEDARAISERALALSVEHNFPYWWGWSNVVRGWAISVLGDPALGIQAVRDGIKRYDNTGAAQIRGYSLCLLADSYQKAARPNDAVNAARAAIEEMDQTGIVFYRPEAFRLLGEAKLSLDRRSASARRMLVSAFRFAERQSSYALQMKAANSIDDRIGSQRLSNIVRTRIEANKACVD